MRLPGDLVAKIEGGSLATQVQDRVLVPRQVVRLQGNNAAQGREILRQAGLDITAAETLGEAGQRAVTAARAAG